MGIAHQVATDAVTPEPENYYATISFVNGVVTSKSHNAPGGITTRPNTLVSGGSTSLEPMYNSTGSQISHESTATVYGPAPFL